MSRRAILSPRQVCHYCECLSVRHTSISNRFRTYRSIAKEGQKLFPRRNYTAQPAPRAAVRPETTHKISSQVHHELTETGSTALGDVSAKIQLDLDGIEAECKRIMNNEDMPIEDDILSVLERSENIAQQLDITGVRESKAKSSSVASALLELEESSPVKDVTPSKQISPATQKVINRLSNITYELLLPHKCYVTPNILSKYVDLQYVLQKPETLADVFYLYANKPVPVEGSSPIKYGKSNPNKAANAVPLSVASRALQTAINAKQLTDAMNIVGTSFATSASRRAKFVRRGLLPVTGLAAAPVAAYTVATQFGLYQTSMDPQMATNMAFVGILAYVGFTTTIGVVAVTTANDQMDRVTWAPGIPLRERWIREEERAAIDRIAGAWGFRQTWRRGEEEGQDWDTLREWVGRKGMLLDRSELMEGME